MEICRRTGIGYKLKNDAANKLSVMPMIMLSVLVFNYSFAGSLYNEFRRQTDSLKSRGVEKVFVHQYSLFNRRYEIPYANGESRCENVPTYRLTKLCEDNRVSVLVSGIQLINERNLITAN